MAAALKDLPGEVQQLDYVDFQALFDMLLPLLEDAFEEVTEESIGAGSFPDLPYFMLSWGWDTPRGIVGKARLYPKGE